MAKLIELNGYVANPNDGVEPLGVGSWPGPPTMWARGLAPLVYGLTPGPPDTGDRRRGPLCALEAGAPWPGVCHCVGQQSLCGSLVMLQQV